MRQEGHENRAGLPVSNRVYIDATAGGTVTPGMLLKATGNPFTVSQAGDGEAVFGISCSFAGSGDRVRVLVQGRTVLTATGAASWAAHRRVCAAASNEVDEGSPNDPWFATLVAIDGTSAEVDLCADGLPAIARGLRGADGTQFALGTLTADQPLVLRSGRSESYRPLGTTAERPSSPFTGQLFYDTDVDKLLTWDGVSWVDPIPAGAGTGDVVGPASSVAGNLAQFADTTGKLLEDSLTSVSSIATTITTSIATHASDTSTHGVTEIVGKDEVQTLTNKTLTAPTINDGTINLDGGVFVLPQGTSDPGGPVTGQIWLRTDL